MTKVYIADTTQSITVDEAVYTVQIANSAADTTITTSGSGISLINTSTGGTHVLNSVTGGANVTITDDNAGNLTIAATDTEDNLSNNDTDDLSEGGTNQYFTDARVMTSLQTVSGDIIPDGDNTRSLGSPTKEWKDVYIGPGSLYIDGHKVLGSAATGTINITTDTDQTLDILAGGLDGTAGAVNIASKGNTTSLNDTTIYLGPSVSGGTINARGTLEAPDLHNGALEFGGTLINQTDTNQNLEIRTNGSGYLHTNVADLYIGPLTGATKIDGNSITTTAGNLTISAFGTVDIAGHNTTTETAALIATAKTEANTYSDAAVAVLTSGASAAFDTLVEIKTLMDSGDATLNTAIGNLNHDTLSGFVANEHIDWTTDQGSTNIHAGNYTDTNTVYTDAEAISAIEGETTLDLSGTVTIDELTFTSGSYPWGETYNQIEADANRVLALKTTGSGYIYNVAPTTWFGDNAGAFFQSNSSAASTLKPFGGQALHIGPNTSGGSTNMVVTLEGDVSGGSFNGHEVVSNKDGLTIPGVPAWGGFNFLSGGGGVKSATTPNTGYPFVGIQQSSSGQNQPEAAYFINHMKYDISGGLSGTGVQVKFAAQDETGKLIDIAANLCKIRGETVSGSSGSSTVDSWDSEYTLTVTSNAGSGANNVGTNVLTSNINFTEVSQELRVVNKPGNSGNTSLSGLHLVYDGAETGTPTAKIKLRDEDGGTTTSLIELTEAKVDFKKVVNLASNTTTEQNALTAVAGDMIFNSTTSKFMGYNGSAWVELG
jgi:hypothetical protein